MEKGLATNSAVSLEEGKAVEKEEVDRCCCISWTPCGAQPTEGCCGLKVDQRPDLTVWLPEDKYAMWVPLFFVVCCTLCSLIYMIDPVNLAMLEPPPLNELLAGFAGGPFLLVANFPFGCLVWYKGWSVAFTRKIFHIFGMVVVPATAISFTPAGTSLARQFYIAIVWTSLGMTLTLGLMFLQPVRRWFYPAKISFAALDRTEDRPFANLWLLVQATAMTMVQTPMIEWMLAEEKGLLIWIPFMAVGLGDGLAEPVGRMWGKHTYEVTALCTSKKFTRSYEGSATVFIFTLVAVLIALPEMTLVQAVLCILTIPLANTLAEAWSPHTFDNHYMFGVTWVLLWLIFDVLPTQ